uniref:Myb/SANT-like DNA-binding domain-containing protein n=1 Tax=Gouania willdenowi TaxID=441366 RepID=A0A8C5DNI8_GOUWI
MARGQTWSNDEVTTLIDIWADEHISRMLLETHKNKEVFRMFSQRLAARGFHRSGDQCRTKVKKLRQQYYKVRDSLQKGALSVEEREKFPLYNDLDDILGSRPPSSPVCKVENEEVPATPQTPTPSEPGETSDASVHLEPNTSGENISF